MNQLHKNNLTKVYQNRELVFDEPINQWCYFIFESNEINFGAAFARLELNELATGFIARNDDFEIILAFKLQFEYWYDDDIDKGIYVCFVEGEQK